MSASVVRTAITLGVAVGVYGIAAVYLIVSLLPPFFGVLIPIFGLIIPLVLLWPTRFDADRSARWLNRLGHRAAAILGAGVIAAIVSFAIILAVPGYLTWSDNQHRAALQRRGMAAAEIEEQVAAHHQTAAHFARDGAFFTAVPGMLAALVTTAAGGVLFRRRPSP